MPILTSLSRALILGGIAAALWAPAAQAYRPFEGTDAGVAEAGVFELELAPVGFIRNGASRTLVAPYAVGNIGFEGDTEFVFEGKVNREQGGTPDGYRTSLGDTALSVKHLFRHGSLQEGGTGVSLAAECGILMPEYHGDGGTGATCAGIASQRFEAATVHLNVASTRTRDHRQSRFLGVIVEGDSEAPVRPVTELFVEHDNAGSLTRSALLGVIWKHGEELSFDAGIRHARTDGETLTEVRLGLTWSFAMHR